jgi:N-acyl-D-amino-acid deacylase
MTSDETGAGHLANSFDLLLRGGTVFDGLGNPPRVADVAITDDRIVAVGDLSGATAGVVADVAGQFVAPGFIDIHTHSDLSVLFTRGMDSSLAQGVTSEVVGNCGFSLGLARDEDVFALEKRSLTRGGVGLNWHDLAGFLHRVEGEGVAVNLATLAGHGTLRKRVVGLDDRPPDAAELRKMQGELASALEQGAVGLSSGLEYVPGMYADVAELTALAKVARDAGTFYATHLRDEGDLLEESVAEAIAVAEGAGLPLQLSHHKAERARNWGKVARTLALVDAAEARGLDVLLDQYPYTAYQTGLATIALPGWAVGGTPLAMAERLRDPENRARIRAEMGGLEWETVIMAVCQSHPELIGRSVGEIAATAGADPRDVVLDLLSEGEGWVSAVHFALSPDDVERVMADPRVMIGSDAVAMSPTGVGSEDRTHPRSYGTFARVLARYVRERGLLTWQEAIRRMTSLPARRLGWTDRGRIAPGAVADLVVFDPETVADAATFDAPHALATGVSRVYVAGRLALKDGQPTGALAGRILRRNGEWGGVK